LAAFFPAFGAAAFYASVPAALAAGYFVAVFGDAFIAVDVVLVVDSSSVFFTMTGDSLWETGPARAGRRLPNLLL
jgi:hypothetical protein